MHSAMKGRRVRLRADRMLRVLTLAVALLALPALVSAQFGHPLKGQWSGEAGSGGDTTRLLLDLNWDGKAVTGKINPGSDTEADIKKVTIDYSKVTSWDVQMEAEGKDASGKAVPIRIDGTLENLGAYYRVFHGTWTHGGQKTPFTVTRN
jgi:hypothetical protein